MTTLAANGISVMRNGNAILREVDVSFGATGAVAIIGPNGAGKSTLLKVLAGIENPDRGSVLSGGQYLREKGGSARAAEIGYIPQYFTPHWDHSVHDLLELGAARANPPRRISHQLVVDYELTPLLHRRWSTLSGGERARALLAMVLAVDPPALLADEPGASLDIRHRLALLEGLVERAKTALTIVVMHDLDLALRYFERILLLDRGRIVFDGPARQLLDDMRLDETFGVRFRRLEVDGNIALYPSEAR